MHQSTFRYCTLLACLFVMGGALAAESTAEDDQAVRALLQQLVAAYESRDVPTIMAFYVPDESLIAFDMTPPLRFVGAKAFSQGYQDFYAAFPGPVTVETRQMNITTTGALAYAHGIDTWTVTDPIGKQVSFTVRETYVLRKLAGKWLIIHEHASVPVDFNTGKAAFSLDP